MATSTANLVHDNSSLANFKAWAQFISNAFSTFGWTQTADTGQVNWATIAAVPSNTYVYEIWKMADTLQTTCPVFVKVGYGYNGTTVRYQVSVGQGSDGAGNLTGAVAGPYLSSDATSNNGVTTYPCYASGDTGSFRCMMWQTGTNNNCCVLGIERSKDSTGANTGSYVSLLTGCANDAYTSLWSYQQLMAGNSNPTNNLVSSGGGWPYPAIGSGATLNYNGTTGALPLVPQVGYADNPQLDWCGAAYGDVVEGATNITVSIYGSNHNYVSTKQSYLARAGGTINAIGILMRYE